MKLSKLCKYLDDLLEIDKFPGDSSNNGLQVEGVDTVKKALFGVDACAELFESAVEKNADFIMVHHGLSWRDNLKRLSGLTAGRLRILFANGISLYAAHLPLDAHVKLGNNAQLADMINLQNRKMFFGYSGRDIGVCGKLKTASTPLQLAEILSEKLDCDFDLYGDPDAKITGAGIISGGAGGNGITATFEAGLPALITGEITHEDWHLAMESGLPIIALGHYRSEKPGVMAVMEKLQKEFKLKCEFIDLPTGK